MNEVDLPHAGWAISACLQCKSK